MNERTLELTGSMAVDTSGNFTMQLQGAGATPPDPEPPEPEPPPVDVIKVTPTGGDDTQLLQSKFNELPAGYALMLSGMFRVENTLWLDGADKTVMGDPDTQSGLRPSGDNFTGHYGALLCTTPGTIRCRLLDLEFDGQSQPREMVFFDGGSDNTIESCWLHDIMFNPSGPPCAAIHSQATVNLRVLRNRVERTGGADGIEGVRGIWVPGSRGTVVIGNHVSDTGHTCIAVEGQNAIITDNICENSLVQGTGMKVCYRGSGVYRRRSVPKNAPAVILFARNEIRGTVGAGLMLENCASVAVLVTHCVFTDCGRPGTTFGAIYTTSYANGITIQGNRFEHCQSVGGARHLHSSLFQDNAIVAGTNPVLYLEDDCHEITLDDSGQVNVGTNCSQITVDGVVIA
jgi:hypothetical protein